MPLTKGIEMRTNSITIVLLLSIGCSSDYELTGKRPNVDPGDVTDCQFSPISGTKISQYDCNPVYPNDTNDVGSIGFYATEVLGHPFYQMWYGGDNGIEYAVSSNGTDWEPHESGVLLAPDPVGWDKDALTNQVIVWDPLENKYLLSYQGYNLGEPTDGTDDIWGIGMATSPDGISWEKHTDQPVINFGEYQIQEQDYWNYFCNDFVSDPTICSLYGISYYSPYELASNIQPCWPLTITLDDRGLIRSYIGAKSTQEVIETGLDWARLETDLWNALGSGAEVNLYNSDQYAACHMYRADALDLDTWIMDEDTPTISGGPEYYDAGGISSAAVVELNDVSFMFYVGFEQWLPNPMYEGVISANKLTLNMATSVDGGETWTKDPNNPLPINLTSPGEISAVGAQIIGERIHFWVTDQYPTDLDNDTPTTPDEIASSVHSAVGYFYLEPDLENPHP